MDKYCRNCGTKLDGSKFCPECGTPADITYQTSDEVSGNMHSAGYSGSVGSKPSGPCTRMTLLSILIIIMSIITILCAIGQIDTARKYDQDLSMILGLCEIVLGIFGIIAGIYGINRIHHNFGMTVCEVYTVAMIVVFCYFGTYLFAIISLAIGIVICTVWKRSKAEFIS